MTKEKREEVTNKIKMMGTQTTIKKSLALGTRSTKTSSGSGPPKSGNQKYK